MMIECAACFPNALRHALKYAQYATPLCEEFTITIAVKFEDALGEFIFLVECKRYSPRHRVGVEVVRSLQGVLSEQRANGEAIVTTSFFTRGAEEF